MSKRQTCVSHSTPEAELVAADTGVRREGLPAISLWETLLGKKVKVIFMEDNSAAIRVMETGKNPTMSHMSRTHGVSVKFLHECLSNGLIEVRHCHTTLMAADIFTKAFTSQDRWFNACLNIGVVTDGTLVPNASALVASQLSSACKVDLPSLPPSVTNTTKRTIIEFCCGPAKAQPACCTRHVCLRVAASMALVFRAFSTICVGPQAFSLGSLAMPSMSNVVAVGMHDDVKVPDTRRRESRFSLHRVARPKHI
jgi:hypothetical protein